MENNKIKVSVIIPVYNTEKYVREAILSITQQSLKELEIIIINDGSTDGSLDIVEKIRNFIGYQAGFSDRDLLQEIQKFITVHLDSQGIILYMDVLGNLPRARNSYK